MQKVKTISGAAAVIKRKPFIRVSRCCFAKNEHNLFIFQFIILDMRAPHTHTRSRSQKHENDCRANFVLAGWIFPFIHRIFAVCLLSDYTIYIHSLHSHFLCAPRPSRHMKHFNESIQTLWRG